MRASQVKQYQQHPKRCTPRRFVKKKRRRVRTTPSSSRQRSSHCFCSSSLLTSISRRKGEWSHLRIPPPRGIIPFLLCLNSLFPGKSKEGNKRLHNASASVSEQPLSCDLLHPRGQPHNRHPTSLGRTSREFSHIPHSGDPWRISAGGVGSLEGLPKLRDKLLITS